MNCHECARRSVVTPSVGLCRRCLVALCKDHLVESHASAVVPQYGCDHHPELVFADARQTGRTAAAGERVTAAGERATAAV